jgi:hypothetical protein
MPLNIARAAFDAALWNLGIPAYCGPKGRYIPAQAAGLGHARHHQIQA